MGAVGGQRIEVYVWWTPAVLISTPSERTFLGLASEMLGSCRAPFGRGSSSSSSGTNLPLAGRKAATCATTRRRKRSAQTAYMPAALVFTDLASWTVSITPPMTKTGGIRTRRMRVLHSAPSLHRAHFVALCGGASFQQITALVMVNTTSRRWDAIRDNASARTCHIALVSHQVEGDAGEDERLQLHDRDASLEAQLPQRALARDQFADDGGGDAQHCTSRACS